MTSIRLDLAPTWLPSGLADHAAIECPGCKDVLVIHQPDERSPDRLLGACAECGAWYLIDETDALMLRLPDVVALREALSSSQQAAV